MVVRRAAGCSELNSDAATMLSSVLKTLRAASTHNIISEPVELLVIPLKLYDSYLRISTVGINFYEYF